jgi:hypothetical protein
MGALGKLSRQGNALVRRSPPGYEQRILLAAFDRRDRELAGSAGQSNCRFTTDFAALSQTTGPAGQSHLS